MQVIPLMQVHAAVRHTVYLSHCDTGFTRMSSFVHDDVIMIATTVNQATDTISPGYMLLSLEIGVHSFASC